MDNKLKITGLLFFSLASLFVYAQNNNPADENKSDISPFIGSYLNEVSGSPFLIDKYSSVTTGSAYYKDEFLPATLFFEDQKAARSDKVRLDLLDNSIHFLNSRKEELIVTDNVSKIIFDTPGNTKEIFIKGTTLPTDHAAYKKSWFQVLQHGDITVYILYTKTIFEYKPFNSGVLEKNIETNSKYFIINNGVLTESKKAKQKK
ncbi:hypothetical protein [Flavihumibacter profundi]|jgi:hypothetical protein|uniref:hypothetical protein n=1 Tax=Flavihumibacter profundi TaxID=2716883 RepID=UPI001CC3AB18|nr:hypothetical protein [Flavihumibacter profundi]MBZ5857042.1 hypothetical protein [Flavihumibacter profundi]